jgi:hypothetical protein
VLFLLEIERGASEAPIFNMLFSPPAYKFCDSNLRPPFLIKKLFPRFLLQFTSRTLPTFTFANFLTASFIWAELGRSAANSNRRTRCFRGDGGPRLIGRGSPSAARRSPENPRQAHAGIEHCGARCLDSAWKDGGSRLERRSLSSKGS